ncbi:hypothetical protein TNCT_691281 [Trichonephila clavata]|uniref:Uncharacterized protein n=1 Tax=Trichonephila clavata TaxID=2740835 RepID=A0A8X6HYU0_TRICU|nr:hypothetical protein TNCT_691281 [Trichonephila clavata]
MSGRGTGGSINSDNIIELESMSWADMEPPVETPEDCDMEERKLEEQACLHLSHLWSEARKKRNLLNYLRITVQSEPPCLTEAGIKDYQQDISRLDDELQTLLGEITLVNCPIN